MPADERTVQHLKDVEAQAAGRADAALREARHGEQHGANRPELGRRAAAALPANADAQTRAAVSGLAHCGDAGRSRFLLVRGTKDDAALIPASRANAARAEELLCAGTIRGYANAADFFAALEQP